MNFCTSKRITLIFIVLNISIFYYFFNTNRTRLIISMKRLPLYFVYYRFMDITIFRIFFFLCTNKRSLNNIGYGTSKAINNSPVDKIYIVHMIHKYAYIFGKVFRINVKTQTCFFFVFSI